MLGSCRGTQPPGSDLCIKRRARQKPLNLGMIHPTEGNGWINLRSMVGSISMITL